MSILAKNRNFLHIAFEVLCMHGPDVFPMVHVKTALQWNHFAKQNLPQGTILKPSYATVYSFKTANYTFKIGSNIRVRSGDNSTLQVC